MIFNKFYSYIIKHILVFTSAFLLIFGFYNKSSWSIFIGLFLLIVSICANIYEAVLVYKYNNKTKRKVKGVLRKYAGSTFYREHMDFPISEKNILKTFKLLIEKQNQLEILRVTSERFNSTIDINSIVEYIYEVFKKLTGCDRCLICFKDANSPDIYCKYEIGEIILSEVGKYFNSESVITKCFMTNSIVVRSCINIDKRGIVGDKLAIPLSVSNEQLGVIFLETANKGSFKKLNQTFLKSLANYCAVAMDKSELFRNVYSQKQEIEALYEETAAVNDELNSYIENLSKTKEELRTKNEELQRYSERLNTGYIQTVMSLVYAIEAKDSYTSGHCQRVMEISCEIASKLNFDEESINDLRYAALLHDIGKIGIPASILNKNGRLTKEEFEEIQKHPQISYNILKDVEFLGNGLKAILEHHEKYDGTGYPNGIKGEQISLFGRILCIADAFDAMTSDRTYRKGMSMEIAIDEIEKCSGTQFDPEISTIFINMIRELISG